MLVTSEVSKHSTMVLFEEYIFLCGVSLVNTKLIPRQGNGVVVGEDILADVVGASVKDIGNLIEFVLSNK